jgi:ureidoacrylate peracid hydrolase
MTRNRHMRPRPRPVGMPQRDNCDIVLYVDEDQRCLCTAAERVADAMIEAQHGIHQLIVMGLIAHTCVEATVRYADELGYEVTMVKDATADYSEEEMHAALDVNIPNYARAMVTTNQVVDSISGSRSERC